MADVSGYTDYGRVWREFLAQVEDDLHPRATVIVLGDARTNGRDPRADIFARIAEHAGRTFWLNPEPRLYWNYGDSVIAAYEPLLRGLRVLDDPPARGLREGAHAPHLGLGGLSPLVGAAGAVGPERRGEALELLLARRTDHCEARRRASRTSSVDEHGGRARALGEPAGDVDGRAEPVAPAVHGRAVGDAGPQRREALGAVGEPRPAAAWTATHRLRARARRASPRRRSA